MKPIVAIYLDILSWTAMIVLVWFGPTWGTKVALSLLIVLHIIILGFMLRQFSRR
jgi:hypothetical protein